MKNDDFSSLQNWNYNFILRYVNPSSIPDLICGLLWNLENFQIYCLNKRISHTYPLEKKMYILFVLFNKGIKIVHRLFFERTKIINNCVSLYHALSLVHSYNHMYISHNKIKIVNNIDINIPLFKFNHS